MERRINLDERIKILAHNLVTYSMNVQKNEKAYIHYTGESTKGLARQIMKEVYAVGGLPFPHYTDQQVQRELLLNCTKEQLKLSIRRFSRSAASRGTRRSSARTGTRTPP